MWRPCTWMVPRSPGLDVGQSEALETFGIERDLLHTGVPAEGIEPLLAVMRANLDHLNDLRRDVLARSQADLFGREARHD
jgi:hypothetical protein